jgi:hypothetical protein
LAEICFALAEQNCFQQSNRSAPGDDFYSGVNEAVAMSCAHETGRIRAEFDFAGSGSIKTACPEVLSVCLLDWNACLFLKDKRLYQKTAVQSMAPTATSGDRPIKRSAIRLVSPNNSPCLRISATRARLGARHNPKVGQNSLLRLPVMLRGEKTFDHAMQYILNL